MPVSDRTSSSAFLSSSGCSLDSFVPSQPRKNDSRDRDQPRVVQREPVEVHVGWNSDGLTPVTGLTGAPETTGEKMISPTQMISPP